MDRGPDLRDPPAILLFAAQAVALGCSAQVHWRFVFLSVLRGAATVPVVMLLAASEIERLRPTGRPLAADGDGGFSRCLRADSGRTWPGSAALCVDGVRLWRRDARLLRLLRTFAEEGSGGWLDWALLAVGAELTLWSHALGLLYAAASHLRSCRPGLAGPFLRSATFAGSRQPPPSLFSISRACG